MSHDPQQRRLLICTAVALAVHVLLIVGLPRWGNVGRPGLGTSALVTRMIGPTVPEQQAPAPELAPAPVPTPPQELPAEPERPAEPQATPVTKAAEPTNARAATRKTPSEKKETNKPVPVTPPPGGATGAAGAGSDQEPSILSMPPPPQFAPFPPTMPIELRPTDADAATARASIKSAGDAPVLVPQSAQLTYKATGTVGGAPVDVPSRLLWRHDGTFYESQWVFYQVKIGQQTRNANGLVTPQGLAPLAASLRTNAVASMSFDHPGERLNFAPEVSEWKILPGTQDRLSLIVQLGALIAGDPKRYPPGSTITLPIAVPNPPAVLEWSFVVGPEEQTIEGMAGKPLRTIHLTHEPAQPTDARMELWLAPSLEYLPARIQVTEANGDLLDFVVQQAFGVQVQRPIPK
ncbi:DUF3108 domain-containing protein [Ottowia thiooxydans]|uniref:DUF3108 domain-containing protein n=1 Tax=Ottowia thiooxydans TaxID=219182 RepID=A0ABV2QA08_9BURK